MSRTTANRERARKARYAITFGLEADAVREGPCVAFDRLNERPHTSLARAARCWCKPRAVTIEDSLVLRWDPAHIVSVGAGGGRFDLISLCSAHHRQQHNRGIDSFAALYGLDLRALADAQALAHERPLGIRGVVDRWTAAHDGDGPPVLGYDIEALMRWANRFSVSESMADALDITASYAARLRDAAAGWPS